MDPGLAEMKVLYNPENTLFTQTRPMQQKSEYLISGARKAGELVDELTAAELTELFSPVCTVCATIGASQTEHMI